MCPSLSGLSDVKGLSTGSSVSIMLLLCLRKEQPTRPLCTRHISYWSTRHKIADRHMLNIFGTCSCNNKHLGIITCFIYLLIIGSRVRFGLHLCLNMFEIISWQLFFFLLMKRNVSTVPLPKRNIVWYKSKGQTLQTTTEFKCSYCIHMRIPHIVDIPVFRKHLIIDGSISAVMPTWTSLIAFTAN